MVDLYVVPAGGNSDVAATYSLTDGGAPGILVPASGDTVFCTALSRNLVWTGSQPFDSLICTGYTGTMSGSGAATILGDTFLLVSGMTYTATGTRTFTGANAAGDVTLTRAGKTTSQPYVFNGVGKTFKLADDHNLSNSNITVTNGGLLSQGFDIDCGILDSNVTNTRTIDLGGSIVRTVGTGNNLRVNGTNLTWTAPDELHVRGTASLATPPSAGVISAGVALKIVNFTLAPAGATPAIGTRFNGLGGSLSIEELIFSGAENSLLLVLCLMLTDNITIDKADFPLGMMIVSSVNGTQRTITTNTNELTADGCMFRDIVISGGPLIATNSIDLGNNSGIVFQGNGSISFTSGTISLPSTGTIST